MPESIVIERLEFRGRCGVTAEERAHPQRLAVDVELQRPSELPDLDDQLGPAIDYAAVARRLVEVGTAQDCRLLETMAEQFLKMLFEEFPIEHAKLWLRKLHPPINLVTGSVGVTVERTRQAHQARYDDHAPARLLVEQLHRLPSGTALDVAAGNGRHSLFLACHGYQVHAIDRDAAALEQLITSARSRACDRITTQVVDLEQPPPSEPRLGKERYDVIVVFFYLYRPLFPSLLEALKPGGMLVYETFTIDNHVHYHHPKRREFCLDSNELLNLASGLQILHYDEGRRPDRPMYTAQLVARKSS
ncbi:MAG: dihydroneopterin aldolase [Nitrospira sp.]|nr:dihydroneopterin aldolase [Nitrospira sp.]MCP9441448.1 dihydroneopterin aldolase [Nitrospira sp.]